MAAHFFRLAILMAMGLGALYMLHLLAQDWNKIRRPIPATVTRLLTGASTSLDRFITRGKRDANQWNYACHHLYQQSKDLKRTNNSTVTMDWKRILSRDPFECLQSLVCQLLSGAENCSQEALLLCDFLEENISVAPAKIARAFSRGLAHHGRTERCYEEYPFCWYSAKTMLKMLKWFSYTVQNES